jgi:hypothetical protein
MTGTDRPARHTDAVPTQRRGEHDTTTPAVQPAVFSRARLRAWRHVTGTSYDALADAAHTTPEHVQACERGTTQPDNATIGAWATVLGCQPDQLRSSCPDGPREYWNAASQAMPPMSADDLAVVADVIMRSRANRRP